MNPRVDYEMSEEQLKEILDACKPTPVMFLGGGTPIGGTPQENANMAWAKLGKEMGFDSKTVRPLEKGQRYFTAVPSETDTQRDERVRAEKEKARNEEIKQLKDEITERENRLNELVNLT